MSLREPHYQTWSNRIDLIEPQNLPTQDIEMTASGPPPSQPTSQAHPPSYVWFGGDMEFHRVLCLLILLFSKGFLQKYL
ncbi:hypothetical protein K8353_46930, partial [Burkholderia contaminans]|nr:hypothetical protein [Burkholderia contaminans]